MISAFEAREKTYQNNLKYIDSYFGKKVIKNFLNSEIYTELILKIEESIQKSINEGLFKTHFYFESLVSEDIESLFIKSCMKESSCNMCKVLEIYFKTLYNKLGYHTDIINYFRRDYEDNSLIWCFNISVNW